MNAVGIDVSKGKSMVAVRRPFNETVAKPFEVRHTGSELKQLADYLKSLDGETRVVLERTGRYYEQIAQYFHDAGLYVSAVNPKLIKDYGGGTSLRHLLDDVTFQATIRQTLQFTLLLLPANVIISLLLATLLKDKFKGCGFFRTAVFTPVVISVTVWGVLWRYIFQTDNGLVNSLLKMVGVQGPQWPFNTALAIPVSVFVTLVKGIGMNMVIFIAALQDVPSEFLEAAALDGAFKPRRFFSVILPCISPSIFLVLILTTINSLRR